MYIILWEYQVKSGQETEFERAYSPHGSWAELFNKSAGYLGTELLHDENQPLHFLTVDRWASKEAYAAFRAKYEKEYNELDAFCEGLTESEALFGTWVS
jgi:heme-degrading monooxygenase HmoA